MNINQDGIIVVVATKNRPHLLQRALASVFSQTKKPLEVFVVSDSDEETCAFEERLCAENGFTYIRNRYTHNYAGNLNTAIEEIAGKYLYDNHYDPNRLYLAFLDDDDWWDRNYLRECWNTCGGETDIAVAGIHFHEDDRSFPLTIPNELSVESFLAGNPHIQGSNTFVKFSLLLKAGCFDENMSSTTDRDLFVRLFLLRPTYVIVEKYLVEADASNNRERLTTNANGKSISLAQFYAKYGGLMSAEIKEQFFQRASRFSLGFSEETIASRFSLLKQNEKEVEVEACNGRKDTHLPRLCFAFVTTDVQYARRLLEEIRNCDYPEREVVIFANLEKEDESAALDEAISSLQMKVSILHLEEAKLRAESGSFGSFAKKNFPSVGMVKDISVARTILQRFAYDNTSEGEAIYVLDEDMEFVHLERKDGCFINEKSDIKDFVLSHVGKADAVVGCYSGDAPLPLFSTLRCALLDFVYEKALRKNVFASEASYRTPDYYYAFSDVGNKAVETPLPLLGETTMQDVFSGRAISRPLFIDERNGSSPGRRGGNTLILNRELLLVPNLSIRIANRVARRGDSLWTILAEKQGYRVIGSSFCLKQNRISTGFNCEKEFRKEMADILGYGSLKALEKAGLSTRTEFRKTFQASIRLRAVRFLISYFRILGLLQIWNQESPGDVLTEDAIYSFIRKLKEKTTDAFVEAGYDDLRSDLKLEERTRRLPAVRSFLESIGCPSEIELLGYGHEGAVFDVGDFTIKVFFESSGLDFFASIVKRLNGIPGMPREITFHSNGKYPFIVYSTIRPFKPYEGGYAKEIAALLRSLRREGLTIRNFKKANVAVSQDEVIYIDLGRDIVPYSEKGYNEALERAYQMIQFSHMDEPSFRVLTSMSHKGMTDAFNFHLDAFATLAEGRRKEQSHDPLVVRLISSHHPHSLLDYGAGKCKIANALSGQAFVSVYDIDQETLHLRADKNVRIIADITAHEETYDLINCNQVLCCVDDSICEFILGQIHRLLNDGGRLILSLCNPFFDYIQKTETRTSGYEGPYEENRRFMKGTVYGLREEYHRPFAYYERLLQRYGFHIEAIYEDSGIDTESLDWVAEEVIFDCVKVPRRTLTDCSLLIKTNPMEWKTLYESVRHIVSQLEKKESFSERVLVVDVETEHRARRFADDDMVKLKRAIERLTADGHIDRTVHLNLPEDYALYHRYFGLSSECAHAKNGQGLLATLKGFEACSTRYAFQTDSDILYFNDGAENIGDAFECLKANHALTLSLSICGTKKSQIEFGKRTEVRCCFLDLERLKGKLPLYNHITDHVLDMPWHRALDQGLDGEESIRLSSSHLFFIHPGNEWKRKGNVVNVVRNEVEKGRVPAIQKDNVDLNFGQGEWYPKTQNEMVVFSRGRNVPIGKIKRLLDSLMEQKDVSYELVYFDDASDALGSSEYVRALAKYHPYWKEKIKCFCNEESVGSPANFDTFVRNVCVDPKAIIVNLDGDDALIGTQALEAIKKEFDSDADVTVGNCLRLDKPLRRYAVASFEQCWERNGDNIWLHPKCFRRYLCEFIQGDLKHEGQYLNVATDYAMMLPIISNAKSPRFIDRQLYLFDISKDNLGKTGKYAKAKEMKKWLLERAKRRFSKKVIAVIGDGNIPEGSEEYKLAFELGKSLVDSGYVVQTGGLGGVMEAVFAGAHASSNYEPGCTIAYIPSWNKEDANRFADIVVPTGLDLLRNGLVVDADAVIAIGGGAGTLSELAIAWQKFKLILAFTCVEGWGKNLAGKRIDNRERYPRCPEDCVYPVETIDDALKLLSTLLGKYNKKYNGIKWRK